MMPSAATASEAQVARRDHYARHLDALLRIVRGFTGVHARVLTMDHPLRDPRSRRRLVGTLAQVTAAGRRLGLPADPLERAATRLLTLPDPESLVIPGPYLPAVSLTTAALRARSSDPSVPATVREADRREIRRRSRLRVCRQKIAAMDVATWGRPRRRR
jgi:hypothetical protein